jgi:hypothetical protein
VPKRADEFSVCAMTPVLGFPRRICQVTFQEINAWVYQEGGRVKLKTFGAIQASTSHFAIVDDEIGITLSIHPLDSDVPKAVQKPRGKPGEVLRDSAEFLDRFRQRYNDIAGIQDHGATAAFSSENG